MKDTFNNSIIPVIMKFVNSKIITALKNGLLYTMPLTIVGSIFLILANFPWTPVVDWLTEMNLIDSLNQAYGATFNVIALVAVIGIAYEYVKAEGFQALNAGIIGFATFILTNDSFVVNADGVTISNVINKDWTGGKGMITAILIGLIVGYVYTWFMKKDIRIKMPESVPEGVSNSFTAIIPLFVVILISTIIYGVFSIAWDTTLIQKIYDIIQIPLQGITDSLFGVVMIGFLIPFLWWFGIHGATIVGGIMGPILTANALSNQEILDAGIALTTSNGGAIVTQQFVDQFMTVTGSGMTIGVVIYMIFFAKSAQNKQLGALGGVPGLFNINEPILFGTPIVLNPLLAIPFMLMPILSGVLLYFAMSVGIVPLFSAVIVPWTTPPIISGFLVGGWQAALFQLFVLVLSFFVYLPFIRRIDKMNLEVEAQSNQEVKA